MGVTPSGVFFVDAVSLNEPEEAVDFLYLSPVGSFPLHIFFPCFPPACNPSLLNGQKALALDSTKLHLE